GPSPSARANGPAPAMISIGKPMEMSRLIVLFIGFPLLVWLHGRTVHLHVEPAEMLDGPARQFPNGMSVRHISGRGALQRSQVYHRNPGRETTQYLFGVAPDCFSLHPQRAY